MPPLILHQIDQLTGDALTVAQIEELRRMGVTGFEFVFRNPIREAEPVEADLLQGLDSFSQGRAELPVVAAGVTCELFGVEQLTGILQPVLAGCAARKVQSLSLAISPSAAVDTGTPSDGYAQTAHIAYTALRDMRHSIEASGVEVNLEAGRHGVFLSPLEMRQVIDAINSWAIGACVDVPEISSFSRSVAWMGCLGRRVQAVRLAKEDRPAIDLVCEPAGGLSFTGAVILRRVPHGASPLA